MAVPSVRSPRDSAALRAGFERIREQFDVPATFPAEVVAEAEEAAGDASWERSGARAERRDRRDVPFVTIDPAPSLDLDQAFTARRRGDGFRMLYAIADVAAFVRPEGALDASTKARGVTIYSPDLRTPLHPNVLAEAAASLLPGVDRPALVWEFDLDGDGSPTSTHVQPAIVRSRAKLSYEGVQAAIDGGTADEALTLLRTIGQRRQALEIARGGVSLDLPSQEVVETDGRFELHYEERLPSSSGTPRSRCSPGWRPPASCSRAASGSCAPCHRRTRTRRPPSVAAPGSSAIRGPRTSRTATSSARSTAEIRIAPHSCIRRRGAWAARATCRSTRPRDRAGATGHTPPWRHPTPT